VPNFIKIDQSVAKILRFFLPSWICLGAYLDHPQSVLGVSITLQNLVMIDAVVLLYELSIFGTFGWKIPIHAPNIVFLAI